MWFQQLNTSIWLFNSDLPKVDQFYDSLESHLYWVSRARSSSRAFSTASLLASSEAIHSAFVWALRLKVFDIEKQFKGQERIILWGRHSTEVVLALPTQPSLVRFLFQRAKNWTRKLYLSLRSCCSKFDLCQCSWARKRNKLITLTGTRCFNSCF